MVATSGTTGELVAVPYSRQEWHTALAYVIRPATRRRRSLYEGLLDARRFASLFTQNPVHVSSRLLHTLDVTGRQLHLSAGLPAVEIVAALQKFRPTSLGGYPSVMDVLAKAQLDGELDIAPRAVAATGEALPADFRDRVAEAWQAEVFNDSAATETGAIAGECHAHTGMHVEEDNVIVEVVDDQHRVLPAVVFF